MNIEIPKAIIGAGGAIIGVVLKEAYPDIKNFLFKQKYKYLIGSWSTDWIKAGITDPNLQQLNEIVEIKSVNGRIVRGTGNNSTFGPWEFKGEIIEGVGLSVNYKGLTEETNILVGTFILKIDLTDKKNMKGVWCQISKGGILVDGTTMWIKK